MDLSTLTQVCFEFTFCYESCLALIVKTQFSGENCPVAHNGKFRCLYLNSSFWTCTSGWRANSIYCDGVNPWVSIRITDCRLESNHPALSFTARPTSTRPATLVSGRSRRIQWTFKDRSKEAFSRTVQQNVCRLAFWGQRTRRLERRKPAVDGSEFSD